MPDIRDITDPTEFIPEPALPRWQLWWVWALVAAGILLVALILYFIFRKNSPAKSRRTLLDKARTKLSALGEESASLPTQTVATRISIIIRRYLEAAFEDPALFETNEEFTLRPNALEALPPESRQRVTEYLNQLSGAKYGAPDKPATSGTDDNKTLLAGAEKLLAHIELHPSANH